MKVYINNNFQQLVLILKLFKNLEMNWNELRYLFPNICLELVYLCQRFRTKRDCHDFKFFECVFIKNFIIFFFDWQWKLLFK